MGWEVCKPFNHANPYDFLIRASPSQPWQSVQVKTAFPCDEGLRVNLTKKRNGHSTRYHKGEFDFLFVVYQELCWFIPWEFVEHAATQIRITGRKYEQWRLT